MTPDRIIARTTTLFSCGFIALWNWSNNYETEFSGGRLTGTFVMLSFWGSLLFFVCAVLTARTRWNVALLPIIPAVLSLPLYLYQFSPITIQWMRPRESFAAPATSLFYLNIPPIIGLLSLA